MIESTEATSAGLAVGVDGPAAGAGVVLGVAGFCAALSGCWGVGVFVWAMIVVIAQDKIILARTHSKNVRSSFTVTLLNLQMINSASLKHEVFHIANFRLPLTDCPNRSSQLAIANRKSAINLKLCATHVKTFS